MSKTKKIISVVLAAALIMAMATVAMISASASTKVYFENSNGWSTVNAYCYGGDGELFGTWPGAACTDEGNGVWSIEMTGTPEAVIFNDNAGNQTSNIIYEGTGKIAKLTGNMVQGDFQMVDEAVWEDYADDPVETTTAAPVVTEPAATTAAPVVTEPAATTAAPVVTEPAATTAAPVVTEPTEAPATEDEPVVPATDDEEPVVTEPTEAPVVTEPVATTAAPVVTEPAATTAAPVVTEPAGDDLGVKVGDVITYTATLETPKNIENIQATLKYSADTLKLVDATVAERFPNMSGVVSNAADGAIYFNASEISTGFDFVGGKTLITAQFEVIAEGNVYVETVIEEMVEFFGPDYVTGGEIVAEGVALTETIDVPDVAPTTTETTPVATTTEAQKTTEAEKTTDVQSSTDAPDEEKDVVDTGVAAAIYVVLAVLSMAAAAVVVLRKKVNG